MLNSRVRRKEQKCLAERAPFLVKSFPVSRSCDAFAFELLLLHVGGPHTGRCGIQI
jgi:hypothetical protein